MSLETPVALFIFNRPDTTAQVMDVIRQTKPRHLLVIADGPRTSEEVVKCEEARAVTEQIDWECQVKRNYAESNMQLGPRIRSGMAWVFDQHEDAIILEDDCVPEPTFFRYCNELLEYYREQSNVMVICGPKFPFVKLNSPYSYYFARVPITWGGFATWRRSWEVFDTHFTQWAELRETDWLMRLFQDEKVAAYWHNKLDHITSDPNHVHYFWSNQWVYQIFRHDGLAVFPATNLVSNIGFDQVGTNTRNPQDRRANVPMSPMPFPLKHPPHIEVLPGIDRALLDSVWDYKGGVIKRSLRPVKRMLERILRMQ